MFFSAGLAPGGGPGGAVEGATDPAADTAAPAPTGAPTAPNVPATCGRFTAAVCAAYTEAATTGRLSPATAELLRRSSPATVTDRITAPTLLVQGEADTLFGLDQADATARQIAAAGGTVRRCSGTPAATTAARPTRRVRDAIGDLVRPLARRREGDPPATTSATRSPAACARAATRRPAARSRRPPTRASAGPRPSPPSRCRWRASRRSRSCPAGGNPAAITSLPGLGGALGNLGNRRRRLHRRAARAVRAVPHRAGRRRRCWSPAPRGWTSRSPGCPASRPPDEAVLFAQGLRGRLGRHPDAARRRGRPAPGRRPCRRLARAGHRDAARRRRTDRGRQPAAGVGRHHGPGLRRRHRRRPCGGSGSDDAGGAARRAGGARRGRHREHGAARARCSGIAGVLAAALLAAVVAGCAADRRRPAPGRRRRRRTARSPPTAARDPRPRQDLPRRVQAVRGRVLRRRARHGARPARAERRRQDHRAADAHGPDPADRRVRSAPSASRSAPARRCWPGSARSSRAPASCRTCPAWTTCGSTGRPPAGPPRRRTSTTPWRSPGSARSVRRRVGTYSQGMRQRLAIAQAMLGLPELLVLDEPTNGLDPPQIHAMREVLQRYAAAGRTVLVSSHLLAEVEQTCSHVVVMHQGTVVAAGTVDDIIAGGRRGQLHRRRARTAPPPCSAGWTACARWPSTATRCTPSSTAPRGPRPCGRWSPPGSRCASAGPRRRLEDAFLQLVGEDGSPDDRAAYSSEREPAGRRGRRDAVQEPSTVAGHVGALPLVEHAPYRPGRTLPLRVELVRQLRRRRTQVAFALVALLPVILWIAFELGDDGPPGGAPNLVDLAKGSGGELRGVRAVRLGRVPAGRGRGAVLRRHGGVRGVVVEPALPARRADPPGPPAAAEGDRRRPAVGRRAAAAAGGGAAGRARSPTGRTTWSAPPASRCRSPPGPAGCCSARSTSRCT